MAGLVIGKLGFGKDDFFYGMELCLHRAGREAHVVNTITASACDVLLVTAFWYLDAYLLQSFLSDAGIVKGAKPRPIIIVGGMQATMTPEVFAELAHYVFIGDADDHLGGILDAIENGEKPDCEYLHEAGGIIPKPAVCRPSGFAINKGGKRGVWRVEIARGCKYKCAFCALSGIKPYTEVPASEIESTISSIPKGASCVLFAPERLLHSEWDKIQDMVSRRKLHDMGQDVRLEHLPKCGKPCANIGIEGPSLRLRAQIGKRFTEKMILQNVEAWLASLGRLGMLTMYFIADLPSETRDDYAELRDLFRAIEKAEWSRKLTLKPVLNPLSPKPFTAMQDAVIHPFRDYSAIWRDLQRNAPVGQWGFRVVESMVWGPYERIRDVIVERGKSSAGRMIAKMGKKALIVKPQMNERKEFARQLLGFAAKHGLSEDVLGIDVSEVF